jgi:hypothetical protein
VSSGAVLNVSALLYVYFARPTVIGSSVPLEAQASKLAVEMIALQSTATARRFYLSLGYEENEAPTRAFSRTLG